jgi:TM2 domain-containing membrane protein YozV
MTQQPIQQQPIPGAEKKIPAGILGILLGGLGIHRFYLDDAKGGLLRILITVITCGLGGIIGLIEGIIYLTKSDEEFVQLYIVDKKEWF